MIIGICGGSGSGKTTLLKRLSSNYSHLKPVIFSMDNYYLPLNQQFVDQNGEINFDLPSALDEERLMEDLNGLIDGKSIEVKEYQFNAPPEKNVLITLCPSELIIVEGLFLFHFEKVKALLDFSIFIDVDPATQLDRRLYRDQESRGYSREAILYQWKNHVLPCYENYLKPHLETANFRFRNDQHADEDYVLLVEEISKRMKIC
jgi:uridine kinase